jgi:uncharacterized protein (TIGR02421 family)
METETLALLRGEVAESGLAKPQRLQSGITERFIAGAGERLREGKPLRRQLAPWGRVHIDRQLPFLVVYRRPGSRDDPGTDRLVLGEASYVLASGERQHHQGLSRLVEEIARTLSKSFGSFLIIEVWAAPDPDGDEGSLPPPPCFRIVQPKRRRLSSTVEVLDRGLAEVKIKGAFAEVEVVTATRVAPPSMPPLVPKDRLEQLGGHLLGVEVQPVFRSAATGHTFPLVRRALHRGLSRALQRAVFEFTRRRTTHRPAHYQALGRRSVVKAVWRVDRELAEVSNTFDFLLQVTPVNTDQAWNEFRRRRFETEPEFSSRPLSVDPAQAKRKLFAIPIERIEDPTLAQLLRDQQIELDRKLTMLSDRGTRQFLYGSLQVYGGVDESLLNLAHEILQHVPSRSRDESPRGAASASDFAARARKEIEYYKALYPGIRSTVQVRPDVVGLMVSRGNVLVGAQTKVPRSRVEALVAHEIGTHVVTYVNGRAQPLRQLYVGLPGYEELQEGLAVLAEYLVGGLSRPRLRLLAARVIAVHRLIEGATFVEVFRELDRAHDFAQRTAFTIAMRVFRGGGLTKDVAYLRGLAGVMTYLREGGAIEPLLVGKLGPAHVPIIEELQWRKVLKPVPLRPRHLDDPKVAERLEGLKRKRSVLDLTARRSP